MKIREVYGRLDPESDAAFINCSEFDNIEKLHSVNEDGYSCLERINDIYYERCTYFFSIGDIQIQWKNPLNENDWNTFSSTVCRENIPDFERVRKQRDPRNPREFVAAREGAMNPQTSKGNTQSTVNDDLIPVDLFGRKNPISPAG
mmetsp:Transcript_13240/g.19471  ORF Transcript_13240/g.19471 Transcript_13240/m.19471 type:complete len:146 (-) Transcript_13240:351-788(-)